MKQLTGNEIRSAFLDYFSSKGHQKVASSSLVPHNDPTLLFTNAGMVQFKDVFLELEERPYKRATTSQKCVRAGGKHNDLDTVGRTARHHTFFEMLGNFSFGNYFKEDAIKFAWEFLTEVLEMPKERLYITVFTTDDEAHDLWRKLANVSEERIIRLGEKDNFWSMGDTGPCGPCSEIIFDRGEEYSCDAEECALGVCDCDRWLEIWNLVFMQYNRDAQGNMNPLPKPSIDTGMGLERVASILQDVPTNYDTDLLRSLISFIEQETGKEYHGDDRGFPFRVIADHARSCTFLIADGVLPSNEGRGYVLRRILRRAARFVKVLGIEGIFLNKVVPVVVELMAGQFPEVKEKQDFIMKVIANEEERFIETLDAGMKVVNETIAKVKAVNSAEISGKDAFVLYDTYGFPIDLTGDIAEENGLTVDIPGFEAAMEEQRQRSKGSRSNETGNELDIQLSALLQGIEKTEFVGYETMSTPAKVVAIIVDGNKKASLSAREEGYIVLDKTSFYGESGGQIGDQGIIKCGDAVCDVVNTTKLPSGIFIHKVVGRSLVIKAMSDVEATVTESRRRAIMRNHTATHLIHKALRETLGEHAHQAGSLVTEERLRFDFSHFSALTSEELSMIEDKVNEVILQNIPVVTDVLSIDEAKSRGAMALFGEKYGDVVRMVSVGDYSMELCGGTHVKATGDIGLVKLVAESSVGAGLRRIEAVTGNVAREYYKSKENQLLELQSLLKCNEDTIMSKVSSILAELKEKDREIESYRSEMAKGKVNNISSQIEVVGDKKLLCALIPDLEMNELREACDKLRDANEDLAMMLFTSKNDKVSMVCNISKSWIDVGLHAGNLIKAVAPVVGGGGGGRPDMAQAGGKDVSKIDEAIKKAHELILEKQ